VKIIALLSWYEEPASWLAECVASTAKLCDHIIAVDGPYALFPGALRKPASGTEQAEIILHTAAGAGIGCTIHAPRQPWWGNEVQKRAYMFRLAEGMTTADDWLLRIDADEVLTTVPSDTRAKLAKTSLDVANVLMWERDDSQFPIRVLFRALPGITVQQAHYVVTAPSAVGVKVLCGHEIKHCMEPAETLWDVRLEHRSQQRPEARRRLKEEYYVKIPQIEKVNEL
jgi:hypothetical protein